MKKWRRILDYSQWRVKQKHRLLKQKTNSNCLPLRYTHRRSVDFLFLRRGGHSCFCVTHDDKSQLIGRTDCPCCLLRVNCVANVTNRTILIVALSCETFLSVDGKRFEVWFDNDTRALDAHVVDYLV